MSLSTFTDTIAEQVFQRLEGFLQSDSDGSDYAQLVEWTGRRNHPAETPLYPCISAFFRFVSGEIDNAHVDFGGSFDRLRILLPFEQTNINPSDSDDDIDTAFAMIIPPGSQKKLEFRIYQRMAMEPWCIPLQNISNTDQLIIAVADVMAAHTAIFKACGVLHRDIPLNNMLFQEFDDGTVRGVLIGFDCAKDKRGGKGSSRSERTGTYPYMSINNLEGSNVERSQLDAWESLIYVLCWLGSTGINNEDGEANIRNE
ncbi:hypothetical protein EV175_006525 [Coemansia sp. RSA 1933]|nr:hypothetical protein EV175_006525 [Coemansia sp. RSA 1933]